MYRSPKSHIPIRETARPVVCPREQFSQNWGTPRSASIPLERVPRRTLNHSSPQPIIVAAKRTIAITPRVYKYLWKDLQCQKLSNVLELFSFELLVSLTQMYRSES